MTSVPVETPETTEMPHLANITRFPGVIGTFMGRDALSLAISYLDLGPNDTVLLPVYTCQEVLRLFMSCTHVLFYDVRPDLAIDPDEVRVKLRGSRVKMMMITNYFGFLQPYRHEIKRICAKSGTRLIEDCAHSLLTQGSGETGDLSIYSFRKILPLPDGGGLRVNSEGKPPVPKYYPRMYSDAISVFIIGKSLLNIRTKMLSRARIASRTTNILPTGTLPTREDRILPLSYFAQDRMANISFSEIMEKRRSDFQFWQKVSERSPVLSPIYGNLPSGVCPLGFAVRAKDRRSIESRALDEGIQLSVHWRLDATLGRECSTSHKLSTEMLTLPVYPELKHTERAVLAGIVSRR